MAATAERRCGLSVPEQGARRFRHSQAAASSVSTARPNVTVRGRFSPMATWRGGPSTKKAGQPASLDSRRPCGPRIGDGFAVRLVVEDRSVPHDGTSPSNRFRIHLVAVLGDQGTCVHGNMLTSLGHQPPPGSGIGRRRIGQNEDRHRDHRRERAQERAQVPAEHGRQAHRPPYRRCRPRISRPITRDKPIRPATHLTAIQSAIWLTDMGVRACLMHRCPLAEFRAGRARPGSDHG